MVRRENASPIVMEHHPTLIKKGIFLVDGKVWSTQKRLAALYGRSIPAINDHLKKMFRDGELHRSTEEIVLTITKKEGNKQVTRDVLVYSIDAVIALGFKVNGVWGKEFRMWARDIIAQHFDGKKEIESLLESTRR